MRVPASPCSCQPLVSLVFQILAILIGMLWYIIVFCCCCCLFFILTWGHFFIAFRQRGRERNTGCLPYIPRLGIVGAQTCNQTCNLGMCPERESNLQPFSWGTVPNQLSHTSQGSCCFNVYFPEDAWCWASFYMLIFHLDIFFGEVPIKVFDPFFNRVVCFLIV